MNEAIRERLAARHLRALLAYGWVRHQPGESQARWEARLARLKLELRRAEADVLALVHRRGAFAAGGRRYAVGRDQWLEVTPAEPETTEARADAA